MDKDFNDLLLAFNEFKVRYLIIGGYACARDAEPRATRDLDLFIRAGLENGRRVHKALAAYGARLGAVAPEQFARPGTIFQIGVPPMLIDVLNQIDG